jgi:thioredoxin 1
VIQGFSFRLDCLGRGAYVSIQLQKGEENSMANDKIVNVTDATFDQEVLKSPEPVLIDFWAPWCGPCRAIAPIVDDLANEYAGRLKVVKINVDDNPQTPARYGVRGIPNLLIIKGGQVKEQIVGAVPKGHLVKAVDGALA